MKLAHKKSLLLLLLTYYLTHLKVSILHMNSGRYPIRCSVYAFIGEGQQILLRRVISRRHFKTRHTSQAPNHRIKPSMNRTIKPSTEPPWTEDTALSLTTTRVGQTGRYNRTDTNAEQVQEVVCNTQHLLVGLLFSLIVDLKNRNTVLSKNMTLILEGW